MSSTEPLKEPIWNCAFPHAVPFCVVQKKELNIKNRHTLKNKQNTVSNPEPLKERLCNCAFLNDVPFCFVQKKCDTPFKIRTKSEF